MVSIKMMTDPAWREFEKLVARMERVLSPLGATVRSPDFVRDTITGEQREVDASIRPSPDAAPIRVVECRDRAKTEDVTWIEQVIAKARDHGIPTVVVSSAGFSKAALAKAVHYGLEARRIDEIGQDEMTGWTHINVENWVILPEITGANVVGYWLPGDENVAVHPNVLEQLAREKGNAAVFWRPSDGKVFRVTELLHAAQRLGLNLFPDIPVDGARIERGVKLNFARGLLSMETTVGARDVARITLAMLVRVERVPNMDQRGLRYSGSVRPTVHGFEATAEVLGKEVTIAIDREEGSNEFRMRITRESSSPIGSI